MTSSLEGVNTAYVPDLWRTRDVTQRQWYVELSHSDRSASDMMQIASVNEKSELYLTPELLDVGPNGEERYGEPEQLTGWRVTLDKEGLAEHIRQCQEIYDRMK